MYEYYRENEEPLTIKECLFLYHKVSSVFSKRGKNARKIFTVYSVVRRLRDKRLKLGTRCRKVDRQCINNKNTLSRF